MLQRKSIEYDGFIKGNDLFDIRIGDSNSVQPDIAPADVIKNGYQYDFHTHPRTPSTAPDLPRRIAKKEARCSMELERVRDETLSPNDAMFAMQYRPFLDTSKYNFKSLTITPRTIIRYDLAEPEKYYRYKKLEGSKKFGAGGKQVKISEDEVQEALNSKWRFIDTSLRNKIYEKQDFSTCGDRDRIVGRKKQWYEFLSSIGMKIEEKPAAFAAPRKGSR